jgi:hypothetical protein
MRKSTTTTRPPFDSRSHGPLRLLDFAKQRREAEQHETVDILRALLARALRGEVVGVALCYRSGLGVEKCVFTGPYNNHATAVNAAARMSWELVRQQAEDT